MGAFDFSWVKKFFKRDFLEDNSYDPDKPKMWDRLWGFFKVKVDEKKLDNIYNQLDEQRSDKKVNVQQPKTNRKFLDIKQKKGDVVVVNNAVRSRGGKGFGK
jgi:hypothetical protein